MKKKNKVILKFKLSHENPEELAKGAKTLKEFIQVIGKITGEEIEIIEQKTT